MKKILNLAVIGCMFLAGSCSKDYLDLKPGAVLSDAVYFTTPDQFKAANNSFYNKMISWRSVDNSNIFDFMDNGSDLMGNVTVNSEGGYGSYGRGTVNAMVTDVYWNNTYNYIRNINLILAKADAYPGNKAEIQMYVAEAKFFRAWQNFFLLKRFGGVPIVNTVLDVNSSVLLAPRNSRYEVVDQIIADLDVAIAGLPWEQNIPAADKGHISKWGAEAFKARVLLYEATWRKYNGVTTDFAGSGGPASDQVAAFLTEAASLAKDVMDNGGYSLWNYNSTLANNSYYFLFNIDGTGSNPLGLDKVSNNEFIIKNVYDYTLLQGNVNLSHTVKDYMIPNRKMMDMFLCTDGLPVSKSPLFKGYTNVTTEYQNRDYRMQGYLVAPTVGSIALTAGTVTGFSNRKFAAYNYPTYRTDYQESQDYPQLRLAEVYLTYAEALMEKNGIISDADLNLSINVIRARTGVASLTNTLVTTNGLDMLYEIRRERALELFGENNRFDDLKRWGIAEQELNQPICGMVVGDASYPTEFRDATGAPTSKYTPSVFVYGELSIATGKGNLKCVVIDAAANRHFSKTDYLFPIPTNQIQLNPNLKQNPGY